MDYPEFLAYLWGIETKKAEQFRPPPELVFSLPMRNWNFFVSGWMEQTLTGFLAYLWGIETRKRASEKKRWGESF